MKFIYKSLRLFYYCILFNSSLFILTVFHILHTKNISIMGYDVKFSSVNIKNFSLNCNEIVIYNIIKINKFNLNLKKNQINCDKVNLFNKEYNLSVKCNNGLYFNGGLVGNKSKFNLSFFNNKIDFAFNGDSNLVGSGHYSGTNMFIKFPNTGYLTYINNDLFIKNNNKSYTLNLDLNFVKKTINYINFKLKNNSKKICQLDINKDVKLNMKNENLSLLLNLNRELIGSGVIEINNKFGVLDGILNFKINISKKGLNAYSFGNQKLNIDAFQLKENKIDWKLRLVKNAQDFSLKSNSINIDAQFLLQNIEFLLDLHSTIIDFKSKGSIDYKENIKIKIIGDYISLLDMKPLFSKKSSNVLTGQFYWKKAKWISDLFLEDMNINLYKSKQGLDSCKIDCHFEKNKVVLWKDYLDSPLHFKVDNFARAFELMYGENIFKSTGIMNGEIYVQNPNMPWSFMLHEFESVSYLTAIYFQLFSLRFWASILKNNQKKWNYLYGYGSIENNVYKINQFVMENDFFKVKGDGFIHKFEDLLSIDGFLLSKSIASDMRDLLKKKNPEIPFQMNGSIKAPKITHQASFRKMLSPILPLTFFLI